MTSKIDVLICGSGSAGLSAATWLAKCGIRCKILDARPGPLEIGQADGVQCRSVEIFESFGLVEELLRESYHNVEVVFWTPDEKGKGIVRARSDAATQPGLSHLPRVLLNQARVNGMLLDTMKRFNGQEVDYGYKVLGVAVDEEKASDAEAYPVTVRTEKEGRGEVFEAKYVLGSDGAHSAVRKSLGFNMIGDTSDAIWGVMDVFPRTNFPDIRKQVIMGSDAGSLIVIPREGGSMVRIYTELPAGTLAKDVKLEDMQAVTRKIFHPYQIDFAGTFWWSAYSIGQRLADHFSKSNRVFLAGDACHTHSPKAGQGMNVSLQDGYNIGWKLASILKGQARPELLKTYIIERQKVADILINFDKVWAKQMAAMASTNSSDGSIPIGPNGKIDFSKIFLRARAFTAGLTITYDESPITRPKESNQQLASNLKVGMRVPSVQVVRFCDAEVIQLVKALPSDGRWRIVVFGGDVRQSAASTRLNQLGKYLFSDIGPIQKHLPPEADIDSFIEAILILSGDRLKTQQEQIPEYFYPVTGKWGMRDLHKVYIDDKSYHSGHGHAYEFYGVSPEKGAIAIVRPDQYVSMVLDIENHEGIGDFFGSFALERR
ncbi:FAD binding domain-containing protein [Xylogone sp. PMI_703]|nr:FAD binding domain-containing protein [Xylogone sp. PMI_703]